MPETTAPPKAKASGSKKHENESNPDFNLAGIGNYTFSKTLGQGNFAKVKLAKHKLTGLEAAIKIIDKTQLDEKKLNKLHREVRIMKLLHHPHTVKLYEVIETKHTLFLVLEYINGGELYDYLVAHGRMKEKDARAKFRQILNAVSYCHRKHVIHRDLKAENLLLDENFNVKVADFGFSNWFEFEGQLDTFCGSPPYAAPELFQGRKYVGPEVDVWSLGVILYVLCTGCLPFDGKDLKEMREVVCRGRYKIPFYLSDSCEKLLRKFLVRDPTKRATLDIVADDTWLNEGYGNSPLWAEDDVDVKEDDEIIRIMEDKFHITRDQTLRSLREDVYDDVGAIYHLFYHEKYHKNGATGSLSTGDSLPSSPVSSAAPSIPTTKIGDAAIAVPEPIAQPRARYPTAGHTPSSVTTPAGAPAGPPAGSESAGTGRERALTVDSHSRRPVTWVGGEQDVQRYLAEMSTTAKGPALAVTNANVADGQGRQTAPPTDDATPVNNGAGTNAGPESADAGVPRPASVAGGTGTDRGRRASVLGVLGIRKDATGPTPSSPTGSEKPRSLRFTFNSNTTSSRPPDQIVAEVLAACTAHGLRATQMGKFALECIWKENTKDVTRIEVEVCELPRLKNLHGLRFKRVSGPSSEYKDACSRILTTVKL